MNKTKRVQVKSSFSLTEEVINKNFHKARLTVMHDGLNCNGSIVPTETMINASESLKNTPILAFIVRDEDGNATGELGGHEMEYKITENNGEITFREHYLEQPIGVIPESANIQFEEIDGKTYLTCDAYLWKSYSNEAYDILVSNSISNASCEMQCKKLEFDENEVMSITDFEFLGVTCIGVSPGMEGANINLNFSDEKEKYSNAVKELNTYLKMELNNNGKEGVLELENEKKEFEKEVEGVEPVIEPVVENKAVEPIVENFEGDNKEEPVVEDDVKVEFGLSTDNLRDAINSQLKTMVKSTYDPYWNETYETREYYFETILPEDKVIVLEDGSDYRKHYGVNYQTNGDVLVLDFDSKVEYIQEWRAKTGTDVIEVFEKEDALKEVVLEKFSKKEEEVSLLTKEIVELREFKANFEEEVAKEKLNSEIELVIAKFSFEESEIAELKEKVVSGEMDIETFEDKLFAIEGRKAFAKKTASSEEKVTKIAVKEVEVEEVEHDDLKLAFQQMKEKYIIK